MEVKEAITRAKDYISDLFATEGYSDLGLEEVEFDDSHDEWRITLGFTRPWDRPPHGWDEVPGGPARRRTYKIVTISDDDGKVTSVKNRELA